MFGALLYGELHPYQALNAMLLGFVRILQVLDYTTSR